MTNKEFEIVLSQIQDPSTPRAEACSHFWPTPISWDAEKMELVMAFNTSAQMANPVGWLHGGVIATMFDNGLGVLASCFTTGFFTPTLTLSVEYLRPAPLMKQIYLHGKVMKLGRSMIHLRGELLDTPDSQRPYATASVIYANKDFAKLSD